MKEKVVANQPRVFNVFDGYGSTPLNEDYDRNTFYFTLDGQSCIALKGHPDVHIFNVAKYENVSIDAVILASPEICFSKLEIYKGGDLTVTIVSEQELSEELKAVISKIYNRVSHNKQFKFELGTVDQAPESLVFDINSNDPFKSKLSKEWVDEVLLKIEDDQ